MQNKTDIVDENDNVIGTATYEEIYSKPLWHRSIAIWVFDKEWKLLVQKRAKDKLIEPGKLANSVAGHVDVGEGYLESAKREMTEEIGIENPELIEIGKFKLDTILEDLYRKEIYHFYFSNIGYDKITLQEEEVESANFYTLEEIEEMLENKPDDFSVAFKLLWKEHKEKAYLMRKEALEK